MNKAQQQVQQQFLHNEKDALNALKQNYQDALEEINDRIAILLGRSDADMQHVIYQVEYQQALRDQISAILDQMQSNNYTTLSDYLEKSYEDGFIGTMYDLQSQGIPLIFPIDQRQVVEAIQHDTKLSEPLYKRLGKDTKLLKRQISQEISRGISNGEMVNKIAKNIAGYAGISQNNAMRIARTESHRIQIKSAQDAQWKAKEKGADIVKQWDSTLDGNTRDTHRKLDGQIRELDEDFEVDGMTASAPGMFGDPAEDCNCRCALLQRARWALDNDYTKWSEDAPVLISDDGTTQFVNVKANDYDSFKEIYKGLAAKISDEGIPEHEEPKLIKTINYNDNKAVLKEINSFESKAINEKIETACVITSDGEVYHCYGVEDRVFPDYDLKEKLFGATISHNHPIEETSYTFSNDDLELFMKYNLKSLRGCDEKYTYEFTWDASLIDDMPDDWMNFENFEHGRIIELAKKLGVGYKRWSNE